MRLLIVILAVMAISNVLEGCAETAAQQPVSRTANDGRAGAAPTMPAGKS